MKAVQIHAYGDADQLRYEDAPTPQPKADEVLVKILATSVNPIDWKIRSGAAKERFPVPFPWIPGRDVAGEVAAVGENVKNFQPGQKVMALANNSYAEYVVVKAAALTEIPEGLAVEEAGALPLVVLTGSQLVEKGVQPQAGHTVLITGALGGVGRTAVYVAKQHGAKVIAGVRSSQKDNAASLGAERVIALDSDAEISALPLLDGIGDTVNGDVIGTLLPKLKKSGHLGSVLGKPANADKFDIEVVAVMAQPDAARLKQLAEDVRKRLLQIPIARRFALREAGQAQQFAEKGANGKVLITTGPSAHQV